MPADYDGDGEADLAVYRTVTGEWFIRHSTTGTVFSLSWGSFADGDTVQPF